MIDRERNTGRNKGRRITRTGGNLRNRPTTPRTRTTAGYSDGSRISSRYGVRKKTARKRTGDSTNFRRKVLRMPMRKKYVHITEELNPESEGKKLLSKIPPIEKDNVRILLFGGVEEIGKNMSAIECGDDIIIVDCGFQLTAKSFYPGIDYLLPNIEYLEKNKDKIKGIVITHGHLDHIGGIAFLSDRLGNPPIYSRNLSIALIKKRQQEIIDATELEYVEVQSDSVFQLGCMSISFFLVTHTIPDAMGIKVDTPLGQVVFTGDVKLDHDGEGNIAKFERDEYGQFKGKDIIALLADSTNVEKPGYSIPEHKVWRQLDEIIKTTPGRLIIGTFASQLERVTHIIESAEKHGRKVAIDGRSMKSNVAIAQKTEHLKPYKDTFITMEQIGDYPPNKLLIMATGAQGDTYAVLMRASNKTHKYLQLKESDTVVLSSSVVPGNELAVQVLKDNITRYGCRLLTYHVSDVHASGHGNRAELQWIHRQVNPTFFIPIHGYHSMLRAHSDAAQEAGIPKENVFIPDNGSIIEISRKSDKKGDLQAKKLNERMPYTPTTVDGLNIGALKEIVIRDRQSLNADGHFNIIVVIDRKTKRLRKLPDIASRGFVYLKESQDLLQETRMLVKRNVEQMVKNMNPISIDHVKKGLVASLETFLFQKTLKRPLIVPVILII